jgi:hypothetical protein
MQIIHIRREPQSFNRALDILGNMRRRIVHFARSTGEAADAAFGCNYMRKSAYRKGGGRCTRTKDLVPHVVFPNKIAEQRFVHARAVQHRGVPERAAEFESAQKERFGLCESEGCAHAVREAHCAEARGSDGEEVEWHIGWCVEGPVSVKEEREGFD